jgi:hypothetical protein
VSTAGANGARPAAGTGHRPADLNGKDDALTEALRSLLDLSERNRREIQGFRDELRMVRAVVAACLPPGR